MTAANFLVSNANSLNELKLTAKKSQKDALPEAVKQFEALFVQSMLKSMRKAGSIFSEGNVFKGKNEDMFQDMMDQELALKLANERGIGLAATMIQQLEKTLPSQSKANEANFEQAGTKLPESTAIAPVLKNTTFKGVKEFIKTLWPFAQQAGQQLGLDPQLLIAQAALETGWGQFISRDSSGQSSNNLFNIKASSDEKAAMDINTKEFIGGEFRQVVASFRQYEDIEQSFNDYVKLVKNNARYRPAINNTQNPERYMRELHQAGYATDPLYADKVLSIYHGGELTGAIKQLEVN